MNDKTLPWSWQLIELAGEIAADIAGSEDEACRFAVELLARGDRVREIAPASFAEELLAVVARSVAEA